MFLQKTFGVPITFIICVEIEDFQHEISLAQNAIFIGLKSTPATHWKTSLN